MQITVRGGDEANVDATGRARAHGAHFAFLEHTEQLGLHRQRHVSQLVQEQGSLVSQLKDSFAVLFGACKGASDVAEKLALQERFRESRAVFREKWLCRSQAASMDFTCNYFFSGAALAHNQNWKLAGCSFSNEPFNASHARRINSPEGSVRLVFQWGG
jgi:hypothetical protein